LDLSETNTLWVKHTPIYFVLDKATKRAPGFKDSNFLVPGFITIYRLDSPSPIVIP
jgi:hypothetical protein